MLLHILLLKPVRRKHVFFTRLLSHRFEHNIQMCSRVIIARFSKFVNSAGERKNCPEIKAVQTNKNALFVKNKVRFSHFI